MTYDVVIKTSSPGGQMQTNIQRHIVLFFLLNFVAQEEIFWLQRSQKG